MRTEIELYQPMYSGIHSKNLKCEKNTVLWFFSSNVPIFYYILQNVIALITRKYNLLDLKCMMWPASKFQN